MTNEQFLKDFAIFILSHERADTIKTVDFILRDGYKGDYFVVIDDMDKDIEKYKEKFGEKLLIFDKKKEAEKTDTGDLKDDLRCGVFARNKIQKFAKELGYKIHLQLDDDFTRIDYRYTEGKKLKCKRIKNIQDILFEMANFMEVDKRIKSLSFGLSSYYLGGPNGNIKDGLLPKCMGSFMMRTDEYIPFKMRMNDDITTCIRQWSMGNMFYTVLPFQVQTPPTQHEAGGMTDIYKDNGTYAKSFYSVMMCPSFVKIGMQGRKNFRLHHSISWNNCCPKVVSDKWKKRL